MKLLTVSRQNTFYPAVMIGADVLDFDLAAAVIPRAAALPKSLKQLFAAGPTGLRAVQDVLDLAKPEATLALLREVGALRPFTDVTLAPLIPDADLVVCGSMNSHGHQNEMGGIPPSMPVGFLKVRSALAASGEDILCPPDHGDMVDWEGEFCVVIGTPCHRVSEHEAMDYVAGYTLLNDVSAREFVAPFRDASTRLDITIAWERNVLGKNFPTFCPLGPVLLTKDEFGETFEYLLETVVNGTVVQSSTAADLIFTPARMIANFSVFYKFQPGDIISMGSPPGVGMAQKPPRFLRPGDTVEVREHRIGSLVNKIARAG